MASEETTARPSPLPSSLTVITLSGTPSLAFNNPTILDPSSVLLRSVWESTLSLERMSTSPLVTCCPWSTPMTSFSVDGISLACLLTKPWLVLRFSLGISNASLPATWLTWANLSPQSTTQTSSPPTRRPAQTTSSPETTNGFTSTNSVLTFANSSPPTIWTVSSSSGPPTPRGTATLSLV